MAAVTPEQKLAGVRKVLVALTSASEPLLSTELFEGTPFGEHARRNILGKLLDAGLITKQGIRNNTRYESGESEDPIFELIENPQKLSALLWPRFEGHLGSTFPTESGDDLDEEPVEEEHAEEGSLSDLTDRQILEGIANNLGGLTQLVAAVFTHLQENGAASGIDLTPFVKSYTRFTERLASLEKKVNNIQVELGLVNGTEEEPRGTGRGVQDAAVDDGEGEGAARS